MNTMIKKLKNIRPSLLLVHMIITLGYPAAKAFTAAGNRLLIFTDAMTVIGLILVILGVVYSMVLHGDFDLSSFFLQRGVKSLTSRLFSGRAAEAEPKKDITEFMQDAREAREESFNYPLFLGIVYLLAAAVIAYGFLS